MEFKAKRMEPEKQVVFALLAMAACVLVLTLVTVWFSNNGIKPEEQAVSASLVLETYFYDDVYADNISVKVEKDGIADMRKLETQVKDVTLRTYMSCIVWNATFTYTLKDGTKEERVYTKSDVNKAVDAFLDKYYKQD